MKKNLVLTLWCTPDGSRPHRSLVSKHLDEPTRRMTHDSMRRYAEMCDADFHCIQNTHLSDQVSRKVGRFVPAYDLFQAGLFLEEYDRVLYLDSDVLVLPQAENIFTSYPSVEEFYAFDECSSSRDALLTRLVSPALLAQWPHTSKHSHLRYLNSGVFLASAAHRTLFNEFEATEAVELYHRGQFEDQDYLNVLLQRTGVPVHQLDLKFNFMALDSEKFNARHRASFIHYAGQGFCDDSTLGPTVSTQIARDYKRHFGEQS